MRMRRLLAGLFAALVVPLLASTAEGVNYDSKFGCGSEVNFYFGGAGWDTVIDGQSKRTGRSPA